MVVAVAFDINDTHSPSIRRINAETTQAEDSICGIIKSHKKASREREIEIESVFCE